MTPRSLDVATVQAKLRLIRELLDDLSEVGSVDAGRLSTDRLVLRAVERILTQLVDLATSVNAHVAVAITREAPGTYRASFDAVAAVGALPEGLAERLKPSVGLRNLLVHEYGAVDLQKLAEAVPEAGDDYADYVRAIAQWLADIPDE